MFSLAVDGFILEVYRRVRDNCVNHTGECKFPCSICRMSWHRSEKTATCISALWSKSGVRKTEPVSLDVICKNLVYMSPKATRRERPWVQYTCIILDAFNLCVAGGCSICAWWRYIDKQTGGSMVVGRVTTSEYSLLYDSLLGFRWLSIYNWCGLEILRQEAVLILVSEWTDKALWSDAIPSVVFQRPSFVSSAGYVITICNIIQEWYVHCWQADYSPYGHRPWQRSATEP